MQQREQLDAGRQAGEEGVEADQRLVGAAGLAEGLQQRRRQLGQPLARLGRLRRAVAAEMPAANDPADVARPLEAEARQRLQRVGIVDVAGEDEVADAGRKLRRRLEQRRIVALDGVQRLPERGGKGLGIGKAQHVGDALEAGIVFGQHMGLLVGDHLDGVLDAAQEPVFARSARRGPRR